jgi:hypothetical protein
MPGPSIPWKTLETEAWRTQIDSVPPARYKLASPRTITGSPSFAMESADQHCVVRVYIGAGEAPDLSLTVSGTTPVPMTNAVGGNLTAQELADLRIEVGMPQPGFALLTTDEPNGAPSAPFATEAERTAWATANLASLLTGRTTVWGPGNAEYVWNGPLVTDWQGIRGPYLGSAENPFASYAALPASGPYVGHEVYMTNPLVERGLARFYWTGTKYKLSPDQTIARFANADGSALLDLTATELTPGTGVEVWSSAELIPDWMVLEGSEIMTLGAFIINDPSSTAVSHVSIRISDAADIGAIDGNNSLSGCALATSSVPSGPSQAFASAQIVSGAFLGAPGGSAAPGQQRRTLCAAGVAANRKVRLSFSPGAATNRIRFYSFTIKTGAY